MEFSEKGVNFAENAKSAENNAGNVR